MDPPQLRIAEALDDAVDVADADEAGLAPTYPPTDQLDGYVHVDRADPDAEDVHTVGGLELRFNAGFAHLGIH